jgi:hypothetical protein
MKEIEKLQQELEKLKVIAKELTVKKQELIGKINSIKFGKAKNLLGFKTDKQLAYYLEASSEFYSQIKRGIRPMTKDIEKKIEKVIKKAK